MKYLKLFDNYYTRLDILPDLDEVPFTKYEREKLSDLGFVQYGFFDENVFVRRNRSDTYIYKIKDEWFYVQRIQDGLSRRIYKCDQFDGVLHCLDEEFDIN